MKNLSYRNKTILLFAGILVLLYFCYTYSFSKTIANYKEIKKYNDYIAKNGTYKKQIAYLQNELNKYTNNGVVKSDEKKQSQDKLFQFISAYILKKDMRINQVPETVQSNIGGYDIETNLYKIQGDFQQLISLVYEIEYVQKLAMISSLQLKKQMDRKTKKEFLEATIYLQNIK